MDADASPAPSQPPTVNLSVSQVGDFGVTMGSRTVTIPASVSATVTVQMSDDSVLLKRTDRWPWTCRAVPATERRFLGGQVWLCPMMTVTGAIIDND